LASYEKAREIRVRIARENPNVTKFQRDLASCYHRIGILQSKSGGQSDALASYEQTRLIRVRLTHEHPESGEYACDLGGTLNNMALIDLDQKRFEEAKIKLVEAIESQRKVLAKNPTHSTARQHLGNHLRNVILAAKGLGQEDVVERAQHDLVELRDSDPQIIALDARMSAVLQKKDKPKDELERIRFAIRAAQKGLHSASAELYAEAFTNNPKLAEERKPLRRYNAACSAAISGSGRGKNAPPLDDAALTKLRGQALQWLEAEADLWTRSLETANAEERSAIAKTLAHWKVDSDLAGIRDEQELAKLPQDEHEAFRKLWSHVDRLIEKSNTQ
jgi:eukaryotic-like serine/threonine-protein kinase